MAVNREGYRLIQAPGHPVAHKSGWALEHRVVLFDVIGPNAHPCHWQCGRLLEWRHLNPNVNPSWQLLVDHLDDDRLNNEATNLVPACRNCNSTRGKDACNA